MFDSRTNCMNKPNELETSHTGGQRWTGRRCVGGELWCRCTWTLAKSRIGGHSSGTREGSRGNKTSLLQEYRRLSGKERGPAVGVLDLCVGLLAHAGLGGGGRRGGEPTHQFAAWRKVYRPAETKMDHKNVLKTFTTLCTLKILISNKRKKRKDNFSFCIDPADRVLFRHLNQDTVVDFIQFTWTQEFNFC